MPVTLLPRHNHIAVDPGKLSGVAILGNDGRFRSFEFTWPDVNRILEKFALECAKAGQMLKITGERYDHVGQSGSQEDLSRSLKILGVWENEAARYGFPYEEHGRSDTKAFMNNGGLKKLGWKMRGGEGHADDAARVLALDLSIYDKDYWTGLVLGSGLLGEERHDGNGRA